MANKSKKKKITQEKPKAKNTALLNTRIILKSKSRDFQSLALQENLEEGAVVAPKQVKPKISDTKNAGLKSQMIEKTKDSFFGIAFVVVLLSILVLGMVFLYKPSIQEKPVTIDEKTGQPVASIPAKLVGLGTLPPLENKSAQVAIIEFSDFQCSFCAEFYGSQEKTIIKEYINPNKVNFYYRDFPLAVHDKSEKAAIAGRCANEQNKFWEMHDRLFSRRSEWNVLLKEGAAEKFKQYASQLGLNQTQFDSCLDSDKYKNEIDRDKKDGDSLRVTGTPTFFIIVPKEKAPDMLNKIKELKKSLSVPLVNLYQNDDSYIILLEGNLPMSVFRAVLDKIDY